MQEHEFEQQVKGNLDQMENAVNPELSRRLYQARRQALTARPGIAYRLWLPAITTATASVLAMVLLFPGTDNNTLSIGLDSELISSQEDLELYQDLEFYEWLVDVEHG